jgi:hypothetical protein
MGELNIATCRLLVSGKAAQVTRGYKRAISQIRKWKSRNKMAKRLETIVLQGPCRAI